MHMRPRTGNLLHARQLLPSADARWAACRSTPLKMMADAKGLLGLQVRRRLMLKFHFHDRRTGDNRNPQLALLAHMEPAWVIFVAHKKINEKTVRTHCQKSQKVVLGACMPIVLCKRMFTRSSSRPLPAGRYIALTTRQAWVGMPHNLLVAVASAVPRCVIPLHNISMLPE